MTTLLNYSFFQRSVADLTVVALNWTDAWNLRNIAAALESNSLRPKELITFNLAGDQTEAIRSNYFAVKQLDVESDEIAPWLSRARNLAAREASGEHVVFLHARCIPSTEMIATYVAALDAEDAVWMGTTALLEQSLHSSELNEETLANHSTEPLLKTGEIQSQLDPENFRARNFGMRLETFLGMGGFDETFRGPGSEAEDFALTAEKHELRLHKVGALAYRQFEVASGPPFDCLDVVLKNSRYFRSKWGHWPVRDWLDAFADFGLIEFDPNGDRLEKMERS